ncbi:hypothetical protein [Streptomyces sp. NBC_01455]|uniref:hypothetical protein n=1 Tax=Streptomyces sp. NBC_01455 TaxID=2903874 RepID=UPI002E305C4A|nr:hypothetical protein [Streptomyces sp. NBC_01455]
MIQHLVQEPLPQAEGLRHDQWRAIEDARRRTSRLAAHIDPSRLPVTWLDPIPLYDGDHETWPSLLCGFEEALCLHRLSPHALVREAKYLHHRTGGYLKLLSQLICQAAITAIEEGIEDITKDLLEDIDIGG